MDMRRMNSYRVMAGIILFGSLWGMLECMLGEVSPSWFPGGAFLGGFVGLGLMMLTRRLYNVMWMQLGMAIVAGALRFWAPVGTCVICSALAIMAEGLLFELVFNRPVFDIHGSGPLDLRSAKTLALLGIIFGFVIYTVGYMFTQIMTPILTGAHFAAANFFNNLPVMVGAGFYAALFGAISVPAAVLSMRPLRLSVKRKVYYRAATGISACCWVLVFGFFHLL
jgi:hypothetical protein